MGALHEGHLQLIRASKSSCDLTVVSIFVNPIQFNNSADFDAYPITLEDDFEKLKQENVDVVFTPSIKEIYHQSPEIRFSFGTLETTLEGAFRPGHFNGVGLVVSKLFNIVRPHVAFFGQKDLQQVAVISRLVKDLSFPIELVTVPTVRESDGLAMSSRNLRLSPLSREASPILFNSLTKAKNELIAGREWFEIQAEIIRDFGENHLVELEYFELIDPESFEILLNYTPSLRSFLCIAAHLGGVRLIDNIPINF